MTTVSQATRAKRPQIPLNLGRNRSTRSYRDATGASTTNLNANSPANNIDAAICIARAKASQSMITSVDGKFERSGRSMGIDGNDLPRNPVFPRSQL